MNKITNKTLGDLLNKVDILSATKGGEDLSNIAIDDDLPKACIDSLGRAYGTGRRKNAVARVWIKPGSGKIVVNNRYFEAYFGSNSRRNHIEAPLKRLSCRDTFDVFCTVRGGGETGQAGAMRHGLSRALDAYNPIAWHAILSSEKFLTRDSRMVESKKYNHHKARRSFQFAKR